MSLWRSNDVKAANTATSPAWAVIKAPTTPISEPISAIAVAQGDSDIIWVGHNNGEVYKTTNGTAANPTWTRMDNGANALPDRYVLRLTIDPNNHDRVFAMFGGYSPDNVWLTTNGGTNWNDRTGTGPTGLPDAPIRSLVIHPDHSDWLYVGTEVGVLASQDGGATWDVTTQGPANVSVDELFWSGTTLYAATHGRGFYSINLGDIVVNTLDDEENTDGDCSLREALTAANNNTAVDACPAGNGPDSITFAVDGTITLGSTLPAISDTVTIDGAGHTITVSGNNSVRVMVVNGGKTLNLNALTIANGKCDACDAGGIYNNGTLNVTNSTFSGNTASGTGGGIFDLGMLNVTNSTFSGNVANEGGGITSSGMATVTNSTFSGNSASNAGGGIRNDSGTITLYNTIAANNTGDDCYGTVTANSNNLDSDGTCDNAIQKTVAEINLDPLADNGGATQTMALLAGSAALDTGDNNACPATDQRGIARPYNTTCDVGAYEYSPAAGPNFVVNTPADPGGDGFCDVANCSLREALDAANAANGANTITFAVDGTITLTSTLPNIDDEVTIDGEGHTITVSGNNSVRVMYVSGGKTLNLNALTIANGKCDACEGGGIRNDGALNVTNSTFSGNASTGGYGGGIASYGPLTVTNSTFFSNTATSGSGGIDNNATLVVVNSTFYFNSTPAKGGGINNYGTLTVTNSTFSGNTAGSAGGGIHNEGTFTTTLYNTIVAHSTGGNCSGTINAGDNNIDTDDSCGNAFYDAAFTLGPLADNGGDTSTMALLAGGSAINFGDNAFCPATDQRGVARPQGPTCDVGAYEFVVKLFLPLVRK